MIEVSVWEKIELKHYSYDISQPAATSEWRFVNMGMFFVNPKLISSAQYGHETSCGKQLVKICVGSEEMFVPLADFNKL